MTLKKVDDSSKLVTDTKEIQVDCDAVYPY